jgi:hypothetical protein
MNGFLTWALARMSEVSTWTGLLTAVPVLSSEAPLIAKIGSAVATLALVLVKEARPLTAAIVVQDAAPIVANAISEAVANSTVK